jgi:hypothetical protein
MSKAKSICIYCYASSPDAAAWMLKFVFAYLANTAVLCYSSTISCCCQVQDYIYWLISTENDHRHHQKFIKYEKQLRKVGKKHARLTYQAKSLPLQHEFGRVALPWVRSNGPTDPLYISCMCLSKSKKQRFIAYSPTIRCLIFIYEGQYGKRQ